MSRGESAVVTSLGNQRSVMTTGSSRTRASKLVGTLVDRSGASSVDSARSADTKTLVFICCLFAGRTETVVSIVT